MNIGLTSVFFAFFGSLATGSAAFAGGAASDVEVDFDVPLEYVARQDAGLVFFVPTTIDRTPCTYGISPPRASKGSLEADAQAALLELVVPGWQATASNQPSAMRGTAAAGWPYFWYRAEFRGEIQGEQVAVSAMAMAFPARSGRVNIVFGLGNLAYCKLNDASFAQLFHSLRPRGWNADRASTLARDLVGTWTIAAAGIMDYAFDANGRYKLGYALRVNDDTAHGDSQGRYVLQGSELVLTPDHRNREPERYHVNVFDEWDKGRWKRSMSLLTVGASPPRVIQFDRQIP